VQTTIRELKEETGINLNKLVYRGIIKFDNEKRTIKGKPFKNNFEVYIYDCHDFDDSNARATEGVLAWIDDKFVLSLSLHESDKVLWEWLARYKEIYGTIIENGEKLEKAVIERVVPFDFSK
jgi:8-oxo-dGTP pyrophosphatase MutT (NUDIX family)